VIKRSRFLPLHALLGASRGAVFARSGRGAFNCWGPLEVQHSQEGSGRGAFKYTVHGMEDALKITH
jgi:hypothetical protein